jgi:hypothetical protein
MFLWTTCVALLLFQTAPPQAQHSNEPVAIAPSEHIPQPRVFARKDWDMTQTYADVFKILSTKNSCSDFYGGPHAATTVLNDLVEHVKPEPLFREISFQMGGRLRFVRNTSAGVLYRLFDKATVNTNGAFYQRRVNPMRNIPSNVGSFLPGSRHARALILLHELGHLIEGKDGAWLIPDDGHDVEQSRANTLRIQEICRLQLKALR